MIDPSSMNSIPMNVLLSLLSGNSLNELQQWMEANMDDDDIDDIPDGVNLSYVCLNVSEFIGKGKELIT